MRPILVFLTTISVVFLTLGFSKKHSPYNYPRSISVTVDTSDSYGSGIALTRKDSQGKDVTFIWTVAHVVSTDNRPKGFETLELFFGIGPSITTTNEEGTNNVIIITPEKEIRHTPITNDIKAIKIAYTSEQLRKVVHITNELELIKWSDPDKGEDLAILKVKGTFFNKNSVKFSLKDLPEYGEDIYVIGSPKSQEESLTTGVISYVGRIDEGRLFDQITGFIHPGSSGSGVLLKRNNECVGLVRSLAAVGINQIVPTRRMLEWAKKEHVEWAMNPNVPMPTDEELKRLPLTD